MKTYDLEGEVRGVPIYGSEPLVWKSKKPQPIDMDLSGQWAQQVLSAGYQPNN